MLLQTLKKHHFDVYQAILAIIGLTVVLNMLFAYAWVTALGYSAITLMSFCAGQGLCSLIRRVINLRRSSSSLD